MMIEYDKLLMNENAYFFVAKKELQARDIRIIFEESLKSKNGIRRFDSRIRESFVHGPSEIAKISLDIFEYKKRPSFLSKEVRNVFEIKFGFFLIVEVGSYLAVIRKNVSGVESFNAIVNKINYTVLTHFLLTAQSKYEKIISSNMNAAANRTIQRKTSEAEDLQGIFSRFGASKQILNSLRIDNAGNKSTITINTSRINSFNLHVSFTDVVVWMTSMIKLIKIAFKKLPESPFLDGFATPVKFENKIKDLEPAYLFIRLGVLKDEIENGLIQRCYRKYDNTTVVLEKDVFNKERLLKLEWKDDRSYVSGNTKVKINRDSITISNDEFKDIILDYGSDYEVNLNQYINQENHFLIMFDQLDYVYANRMIFYDSKLLGDLTNFLDTFRPFEELGHVTSEKGKNYTKGSSSFESKSIFEFIDNNLASNSTYLICDDMGTEWADFISIDDDEVVFYHAKFHDSGLSASNLEEVIGQVQKNLGFLQLTGEMIDERTDKWSNNYKIHKVYTSIKRLRRCPEQGKTIADLKQYAVTVSSNANLRLKINVVLNFISKSELEKALGLLKDGKIFKNKPVVVQMLWFINSLLVSANELGVEFRIICKP